MSATDELRRMLDERGVEWSTNETLADCWTRWDAHGYRCTATEINGSFAFSVGNATPEQAIAATLGGGTCCMRYKGGIPEFVSLDEWTCSECGSPLYNDSEPIFCAFCGAKVVSE